QNAQRADDEYGRISAYDVDDDTDLEDDRDPKEVEREKYGDGKDNFALFGTPPAAAPAPPPPAPAPALQVVETEDADAFNDAVSQMEGAEPPANFAAHAATFHETPVVPELNALEIVPLDGIRDKKVKEIALEVRYEDMTDERVRRIREIVEDNPGEVPL